MTDFYNFEEYEWPVFIKKSADSVQVFLGHPDKDTKSEITSELSKDDLEGIKEQVVDAGVKDGEVFKGLSQLEFTVEYSMYEGKKPFFSPSFGNWLPGDDAEIIVDRVSVGDTDVTKFVDSDHFAERIADAL